MVTCWYPPIYCTIITIVLMIAFIVAIHMSIVLCYLVHEPGPVGSWS